ncbi:unnamed protein product [Rotaria sp. Silwood2]|nr:unnamed protein product [Rotaria sp. Silwood2]CAF4542234.1 unnamed protein product [Rotaria sp. Silwood2]
MPFDAPRLVLQNGIFGFSISNSSSYSTGYFKSWTQDFWLTLSKIKTGDVFQGGTDADVHLKIFENKCDSDRIQLQTIDNTSNLFERGQINSFSLEFDDLGKIEHILIGHNGKNPGAG